MEVGAFLALKGVEEVDREFFSGAGASSLAEMEKKEA